MSLRRWRSTGPRGPRGSRTSTTRLWTRTPSCARRCRCSRARRTQRRWPPSGLPAAWLTSLASALVASDAAIAALTDTHGDTAAHVAEGRDAEAEFISLMVRLRQYVGSRADSPAKEREGEALLRPLLDALKQKRAAAKSRAAHAAKATPAPAPAPRPTP